MTEIPKESLHNHRGEVPWDSPVYLIKLMYTMYMYMTTHMYNVRIARRPRRSHAVISCSYSDMCLVQ